MPSLRAGGGGGTTTETVISGTNRYKYFKRPIMPRVNAFPPHFLLAPTSDGENNPLEPNVPPPEEPTREMGIQTMYRDSEAQTNPYTPAYIVPAGQEPEVLLLKNLTYEDGLPMGEKEMAMIEFARGKREMEMNLPPFTDEASLTLRKRLMETQEMREFRIRESEIDKIREEKIQKLQEAIQDREESNEHMATQRLESVRLLRMEEREKVLEKIRTKRIKALRRLAHQRNVSDPILSDSASNGQSSTKVDIIDAYFDRGSEMYAPLKRQGKEQGSKQENFDIQSRTAPLDNLGNLLALEYTIPRNLLAGGPQNFQPVLASQTMPAHMLREMQNGGQNHGYRHRNATIKAAEPRMTSATARAYRQTKRDVEEMHQILTQKKRNGSAPMTGRHMLSASSPTDNHRPFSPVQEGKATSPTTSPGKLANSTLLSKKPKVRPPTPDITRDRTDDHEQASPQRRNNAHSHSHHHQINQAANAALHGNVTEQQYLESLVLLQRLIRGRAVQNIMFEGKYRRRELIAELQAADMAEREQAAWQLEAEMFAANGGANASSSSANAILEEQREAKAQHEDNIRVTSLDAVGGAVTAQITATLAMEKKRVDMIEKLQAMAERAKVERRDLEAAEAGRRQRQGMEYPTHTSDGLPIDKTAVSTLVITPLPSRNIVANALEGENLGESAPEEAVEDANFVDVAQKQPATGENEEPVSDDPTNGDNQISDVADPPVST